MTPSCRSTSRAGPRGRSSRSSPTTMREYDEVITVDLDSLEPQVVLPGKVAWNSRQAREVAGQKVDQAFIGSCANGRLSDFADRRRDRQGKQVAPGTRFIVTPGSQEILKEAIKAGLRRDPDGRWGGGHQFDLWRVLRRAHGTCSATTRCASPRRHGTSRDAWGARRPTSSWVRRRPWRRRRWPASITDPRDV